MIYQAFIKHSKFLLLADDLKLFKQIHCYDDTVLLQVDANSFRGWCNDNVMSLNIAKCKITSLSFKNNNFCYDYTINNLTNIRINEVVDLGITFDSILSFNAHIVIITNKSLAKLGFIKRTCRDFHDDIALELLYFSLVRSHLEYACLIWINNTINQSQCLSKIQNNFLRFLCYQCNARRTPHSGYDIEHNFFKIMPLDKRFKLLILKFLLKLLNNIVDCLELIERLNFKINFPNSRNKTVFYLPSISKNYLSSSTFYILMSAEIAQII
jgi:hypothetical protein